MTAPKPPHALGPLAKYAREAEKHGSAVVSADDLAESESLNAELLAACEAALIVFSGAEPATTSDGCYTDSPLEKKLRAARARARGETPEGKP